MRSRVLLFGLVVVSGVYLLQMYSPLRLHTDAINYLLMAADINDGGGFKRIGPYPLGYPVLLAGLDRLGLGTPWAFVGLNCVFIGIGIVASYLLYRATFAFGQRLALLLCLLTLMSFVLIKYMAIPLSDMPFLGISMVCLLMISRLERQIGYWQWKQILPFIGVLLLIAVAVSLRTIGIALLPALFWAVGGNKIRGFWRAPHHATEPRREVERPVWNHRLMLLAVMGIGIAAVWGILSQSDYYDQVLKNYQDYGTDSLVYNLTSKLTELGAIALNVPWLSQIPWWMRFVLGIGVLSLMAAGVWTRRSRFSSVEVYFLTYVAILFAYPSPATGRYWLPILPLVFAVLALAFRDGFRLFSTATGIPHRHMLIIYYLYFISVGAGGLVYSSWITFAGDEFPQRYGDGNLASTYEVALKGGSASQDVNERALRVLKRYEPRVHPSIREANR